MIPAFSDPFASERSDVSKLAEPAKQPSSKEVRTGQVLNGVAIVAGGDALRLVGKEGMKAVRQPSKPVHSMYNPPIANKVQSLARKKSLGFLKPLGETMAKHPKKAAVAAAAGLGVLHGAELAGDAIAAHSLHSNAQRLKQGGSK